MVNQASFGGRALLKDSLIILLLKKGNIEILLIDLNKTLTLTKTYETHHMTSFPMFILITKNIGKRMNPNFNLYNFQ